MTNPPPPPPGDPPPPSEVPPGAPAPPPSPPSPPSPPAPAVTDKFVAAFRDVNWKQLGMDFKTFGKRFATSDFSRIIPEPHEQPAVASRTPRMAALIVWRRALLALACVLTSVLLIKRCFDPFTLPALVREASIEEMKKQIPRPTEAEMKAAAEEYARNFVQAAGESNVNVINAIIVILFLSLIASLCFQVMAAQHWKEWRRSRKFALLALGVVLGPQLIVMLVPWSAMMDFGHLKVQADTGVSEAQVKVLMQGMAVGLIFATAIPLFYGLFNGVLRASLATKTLVPASIVCGWGTILLALTIAVPWFLVLSIVDQLQADGLIFTGVLCLLAAPLSIVWGSRRLGAPLSPQEATGVVKKARHLLTGMNFAGVLLLLIYANEKNAITVSQTLTGVIHYFANLMLVSVVAVDVLVLLLDRAHRKLAADTSPDEPLRQLGEVLPGA